MFIYGFVSGFFACGVAVGVLAVIEARSKND